MNILKWKKNLCDIYILLWLFGMIQGFFLTSSIVSLIFSVPFMLITLYCFVEMFEKYPPKGAVRVLSLFFVVLIIYGVALVLLDDATKPYGKVDKNSFLLMAITSVGPVFAFYYFARKGLIDAKKLKFWFFVFIVVYIIQYYYNERRVLAQLMMSGYRFEEITNNSAYIVLSLFPALFLLRKKPIIQYLALGIISYFVISGMKRGALLVAAVLLVWFIYISTQSSSNNRRIGLVLLTIVLIAIGWRFIDTFYSQSEYFQYRVEDTMEGKSSTRNVLYSTLWSHYRNNENLLQMAFGEGGYHTFNIAGNDAHNDWLELLIDCGFVTTLIYLLFWFGYFNDCRKAKAHNYLLYSMIGACFIFMFLRTFFSMSFSDMPFYLCMVLGYCFAQISKPVSQIDPLLIII